MTNHITAMKQALEVLEGWDNYGDWLWPETALEQCKRSTKESLTTLRQAIEQAEKQSATIEDNSQDWAKLDGAVAWHLIERHANNWADVGKMMDEYVAAKLAKPEQEPVAWVCEGFGKEKHNLDYVQDDIDALPVGTPLYTAPPQAEKQEPVAWMYVNVDGECEQIEYGACDYDDPSITFLYTAPPRKEWVGLTELEIAHGLEKANLPAIFSYRAAARAGIDAFKEKNT